MPKKMGYGKKAKSMNSGGEAGPGITGGHRMPHGRKRPTSDTFTAGTRGVPAHHTFSEVSKRKR